MSKWIDYHIQNRDRFWKQSEKAKLFPDLVGELWKNETIHLCQEILVTQNNNRTILRALIIMAKSGGRAVIFSWEIKPRYVAIWAATTLLISHLELGWGFPSTSLAAGKLKSQTKTWGLEKFQRKPWRQCSVLM